MWENLMHTPSDLFIANNLTLDHLSTQKIQEKKSKTQERIN